MANLHDSDPLPSLRTPKKRQSQFSEVGIDPIPQNGKRTMPADLEAKIGTWQRHGGRILDEMRVNSLMVTVGNLLCMVTRDPEKMSAVQVLVERIDTKRKEG